MFLKERKKKIKFDPYDFSGAITLCSLHFKIGKQLFFDSTELEQLNDMSETPSFMLMYTNNKFEHIHELFLANPSENDFESNFFLYNSFKNGYIKAFSSMFS